MFSSLLPLTNLIKETKPFACVMIARFSRIDTNSQTHR